MSRASTIFLGIVNLVPFAYLIFFFSVMLKRAEPGRARDYPLDWLFPLHIGVMVLNVALMIIYLIFAYRSERVPSDKRAFWAVVIFMGNMFAFPVFWYLYVYRQPPKLKSSGAL